MNKIISLSIANKMYKPVLFDHNYILDLIELEFNKSDGRKVNPDLLLKNEISNRLLFVECKDGSLEPDQAKRYNEMGINDIIVAKLTSNISEESKHELAYIATDKKVDKLKIGMDKASLVFPILVSRDSIIALHHNHFSCEVLQELFSLGVSSKRYSDTLYPFGADDSDAYIFYRLIPALLSFIGSEFNPNDLLEKTFPHVYSNIGKPAKKELVGRIDHILEKAGKDKILNNFFIAAVEKKYKLKGGTRRLNKALNKYIDEKLGAGSIQVDLSRF